MKTKICSKCGKEKLLSEFHKHKLHKDKLCSFCKQCRKKVGLDYKEKYPWKLTLSAIKRRCNDKNNPAYKYYGKQGIKCLITEKELKNLWFRDNASQMKRPSIDRINNDGNYIFNNCRYIEQSENSKLMNTYYNTRKPILQYDLQGVFIGEWESVKEAGEQLHISSGNISEVLHNRRKMAGGFIWKYKKKIEEIKTNN